MTILSNDTYRDGGTLSFKTDEGVICIDRRIGTTTKGMLYKDYPLEDNSNMITDLHTVALFAVACIEYNNSKAEVKEWRDKHRALYIELLDYKSGERSKVYG